MTALTGELAQVKIMMWHRSIFCGYVSILKLSRCCLDFIDTLISYVKDCAGDIRGFKGLGVLLSTIGVSTKTFNPILSTLHFLTTCFTILAFCFYYPFLVHELVSLYPPGTKYTTLNFQTFVLFSRMTTYDVNRLATPW